MASEGFKATAIRFSKHTLFSLFGTATNTLVMWVSSHILFTGEFGQRVVSPCIAFEIANIVNFIVSSNLVFKDREVEKGFKGTLKRFAFYNLSYTASFFINLGLLQVFVNITDLDVVICNLLSLMIAGILNFIMNTRVTFRNRRKSVQ